MPDSAYPVLVIGAGPAGLATAACLSRRGIAYRMLERGPTLGHSWVNLYDSLVLHTGRHMSTLPGRRFPAGTPLFPSRDDFVRYLRDYAAAHALQVQTGVEVCGLRRSTYGWAAVTREGERIEGSSAVVCTGILANPRMPVLAGREDFRGLVLHASAYQRPDAFIGKRVLVVGVGNSGGEIGSELARAGAAVTMLVRSGAHVVPLAIGGVPVQYLSYALRRLPRALQEIVVRQVGRATERRRGPPVLPRPAHSPLDAIPIIGFHLVDAIRSGAARVQQGEIARLTTDGAEFTDGSSAPFDVILLATGYRPALGMLGTLVQTDARGFALRRDRVTSADQSALYFVGHNYDATGGLANIRRDAPMVAHHIAECRAEAARLARRRARATLPVGGG
jgi:cation diffusion facilitator CzcD-associated flavoprotein CzcO